MNGARIRSNSGFGTRPANINASVPRLSPPCSARTRTMPGASGASVSSRNSARPAPTYQSACATSFRLAATSVSLGLQVPLPYYSARAYGRSADILLERSTRDLAQYTTASPSLAGRRALYAALVAGTMVGMLWLIGIALSTGGIGLFEV